jgi:hypothetical protein
MSNNEATDLISNPVTASGNPEVNKLPIIQFDEKIHDFGLIFQGEKVSYVFRFKNIGKGNLIIKDASASCGCTVPKFSKKPVATGEYGEIEVVFDSNHRKGKQIKSVNIWTNCQPNVVKLEIISEIILPKNKINNN